MSKEIGARHEGESRPTRGGGAGLCQSVDGTGTEAGGEAEAEAGMLLTVRTASLRFDAQVRSPNGQ